MSYIGQGLPADVFSGYVTDTFTGDGSATTFTLSKAPFSEDSLIVVVDNVIQQPTTNFTVSGTTLTIVGTAILSGIKGYAIHTGGPIPITTPGDNSVTKAKLADEVDIFAGTSLTAADLGSGLHVRVADSSASVDAAADELVLENSGNAGLSILSGTTSTGQVAFGDSGDNNRALISYSHNTDHLTITHEGDELTTFGGGRLQTGGETSGDVDAGGLTLDQNAGDNFILTAKSSDVAHGMTDSVQTDSFFAMGKRQSAGGTLMYAMNSELQALRIIAAAGAENTTKSTTGNGPFVAYCTTKSGTGFGSVGSNGNMFVVSNNGNTKFIVDSEGDIHYDGSASAYDNYEDAHLARALDLSHGKGVIDSKFDKFVSYNHEKLADMRLVGREEDGTPNHFIKDTGMQRLHNGAIWQQYEKHQKLAEAVYEMAKEALGEEKADAILEKHDIKLLN